MVNVFEEILKCKSCFNYFTKNYVKLINPKRGLIPFEVYDYHKRLIGAYGDHRFVITKKFRQSGITTFTVVWLLWKCMFESNQNIFFASKTDREAAHVGKLVDLVISNMPEWLKPRLIKDNKHEKKFALTESVIEFGSIKARCAKALTHLIIDEAAFIPQMDEKWKMVFPLLSTGGKAIILSTVNGNIGNWFADLWFSAIEKKNDFYCLQINYWEHPDFNNETWVNNTKKALGERGWRQEVLGEFLGPDVDEFLVATMNLTKTFTNDELKFTLKNIARKLNRNKDIEGFCAVWEASERIK